MYFGIFSFHEDSWSGIIGEILGCEGGCLGPAGFLLKQKYLKARFMGDIGINILHYEEARDIGCNSLKSSNKRTDGCVYIFLASFSKPKPSRYLCSNSPAENGI